MSGCGSSARGSLCTLHKYMPGSDRALRAAACRSELEGDAPAEEDAGADIMAAFKVAAFEFEAPGASHTAALPAGPAPHQDAETFWKPLLKDGYDAVEAAWLAEMGKGRRKRKKARPRWPAACARGSRAAPTQAGLGRPVRSDRRDSCIASRRMPVKAVSSRRESCAPCQQRRPQRRVSRSCQHRRLGRPASLLSAWRDRRRATWTRRRPRCSTRAASTTPTGRRCPSRPTRRAARATSAPPTAPKTMENAGAAAQRPPRLRPPPPQRPQPRRRGLPCRRSRPRPRRRSGPRRPAARRRRGRWRRRRRGRWRRRRRPPPSRSRR